MRPSGYLVTYLGLILYSLSSCNVGLQSPEQAYQNVHASFEYWESHDVYADTNVVQIYTQCEGLTASKEDVIEVLMGEASTSQRQVVQRNTDCLFETIRRSEIPSGIHQCSFQVLIDRSGKVVAVRLLDNTALPIARDLAACIPSYQYAPVTKGPCLDAQQLTIQLDMSKSVKIY